MDSAKPSSVLRAALFFSVGPALLRGPANNGGDPRILLATSLSGSIWWECHVLEGSVGELQWTTCQRLLDQMLFGRATVFFLTVWF
jgi:hypothetical protein